jgi:hypothetical protein
MRRFLAILMACALALVVFTAAASAKSVTRPFKGSVSGGVWYQSVGDPAVLTTMSSAVGNARHMGRIEMTPHHPTPADRGPDYGPGDMVLTAANGDEVWITYTGHLDFDPTAAAGTWFEGPISCTITGGTGRFAHSSGSADMILHLRWPGSIDPAFHPWAASWVWHGTIRY